MKKLLSVLIVLAMVFALASCGGKKANDKKDKETVNKQDVVTSIEDEKDETSEKEEVKDEKEDIKNEVKEENKKPSEDKKEDKVPPATDDNKAPVQPQPSNPPKQEEQTPSQPKTVGYTLADVFKANSSSDLNTIANKLIAAPALSPIGQSLAAMDIEEGYLTGFDNEEIKGFKKGVMFAPMMGTIPFVGYVFELASADDVAAFTAKLKSASNLRWNICTSADEKVVTSVGNKVFFVMCPLNFEE